MKKICKNFIDEFKEFITRGNVLDLAVGVIIGGSFKTIVDSLTSDIISPILGIFGGLDFSNMVITIKNVNIRYGSFITSIINFLIMALIIFIFVKSINKIISIGANIVKNNVEAEKIITKKTCPFCCTEIDIKAVKCPNCTSELESENSNVNPE